MRLSHDSGVCLVYSQCNVILIVKSLISMLLMTTHNFGKQQAIVRHDRLKICELTGTGKTKNFAEFLCRSDSTVVSPRAKHFLTTTTKHIKTKQSKATKAKTTLIINHHRCRSRRIQ